ncbi:hypothetical protein [Wenjunlia tyrosinilytica]|jgi:hypothetical protein|uniref:Uncharacterized protein n=1 Tax=Wenjunlia tyrosinilytica TaxID=1544741 RepID=A0A917ZSJ6_9ACTN|nr:hypothetical protein [Wenjunlia tyrosinilytica]GGO89403.1 hypothetical protein GCM10012280_32460 [Wenjunlia tyrosinilytica]
MPDRPAADPPPGFADVSIVSSSPEAARKVAEALRHWFATTEQRSYPAGPDGGTGLRMTVDTRNTPRPSESFQSRITGHRCGLEESHADGA